jgi:hypothetical protein
MIRKGSTLLPFLSTFSEAKGPTASGRVGAMWLPDNTVSENEK